MIVPGVNLLTHAQSSRFSLDVVSGRIDLMNAINPFPVTGFALNSSHTLAASSGFPFLISGQALSRDVHQMRQVPRRGVIAGTSGVRDARHAGAGRSFPR